jgi:hypothetical protein
MLEKNDLTNKFLAVFKIIYPFGILSFVVGFLVWNVYLYYLGFSEYEIIQTRFIFTGVLPLILIIIIASLFTKIPFLKKHIIVLSFIAGLVIIFLYAQYLFFYIPSWMGGGQPRFLSIVADNQDINFLARFGIKKVEPDEKQPVQTQNLCIAYENKSFVILLLKDRILQIDKNYFKGFGSIPNDQQDKMNQTCSELAKSYIKWNERKIER